MGHYLVGLAASLAVFATPAAAATTIYTNVGDFQSALTGGTVLEDFRNSQWASPLESIVSANGHRQGNHWEDEITSRGTTTFNFSSLINGFGGDFNASAGGHGPGITVLLFNGDDQVDTLDLSIPNGNGYSFWGLVSDEAFDSVKLVLGTSGNYGTQGYGKKPKKSTEVYKLDDLRFGTIQDVAGGVPEPSTWAMMILGFGLIGGVMRRRQRQTVRYSFA